MKEALRLAGEAWEAERVEAAAAKKGALDQIPAALTGARAVPAGLTARRRTTSAYALPSKPA
jgi:hypothetical protein